MTRSLIDVLTSNNPKSIKKNIRQVRIDQNEISATIDIAKLKYKPITKTFRTHKTYFKENLIKSIKGHMPDLNEIVNTDNVNNQVHIINNVLLTAINNCAPLITTRVKRKPNKWMNDTIKKNIEEREIKKHLIEL